MAQRNVQVPLAGDEWLNLDDLVQAKVASDNGPRWISSGQELTIVSSRDNEGGSFLQITSNPIAETPAYQLLPEEMKIFTSPLRSNNISLQDKWLRIVDNAGLPIVGTAEVIMNYA